MSTTDPTHTSAATRTDRQSNLGEYQVEDQDADTGADESGFAFTISRDDAPESDEEDVEMTPCLRIDDSGTVKRVQMHTCPICGKSPSDDGTVSRHFEREDHTFAALVSDSDSDDHDATPAAPVTSGRDGETVPDSA